MVIISMKKHSALGEKNKNKAGLRFFFHPPRKSAGVAAASSAALRRCCRIPLTGRLSCSSSLLHPTFYLCIRVEEDCRRRHILMLHCTMFVYVTEAQDNAGSSSLCTSTVADQTFQSIKTHPHLSRSLSLFLFFFCLFVCSVFCFVFLHAKVIEITHHMNGVCENERPFQARLVRHDNHCAPLHVCNPSLPGFKRSY